MKLPSCPKCGCPARVVIILKARVRCELLPDGTIGKMLSASRNHQETFAFECGGGHEWVDFASCKREGFFLRLKGKSS